MDLSQFPDGDLKGQIFIAPVIDGYKGPPIVLTNGTLVNAKILNSADIALEGLTIIGDPSTTPVPQLTCYGIDVFNSQNVKIRHCDISRAMVGIVFRSCTGCNADSNYLHDLRRDGVHLINSEHVSITRNEATDWQPTAGDHPDFVQAWNNTLGHAADGHVIEDNCVHRGSGGVPQGIFYRVYDPASYPGYTSFANLAIRRNLIIGCLYNGIVFSGAAGECVGNEVWSFTDYISRIQMLSDKFTVTGNKAQRFLSGSTMLKAPPAGNEFNKPIDALQEAALVAEWRKRVFGAPVPAPGPTPEPTPAPFDLTKIKQLYAQLGLAIAELEQ